MSQIRFANLMGVNPVTVSRWVTGHLAVPQYVEAYLALRRATEEP